VPDVPLAPLVPELVAAPDVPLELPLLEPVSEVLLEQLALSTEASPSVNEATTMRGAFFILTNVANLRSRARDARARGGGPP
jgi:hypothetical protein